MALNELHDICPEIATVGLTMYNGAIIPETVLCVIQNH